MARSLTTLDTCERFVSISGVAAVTVIVSDTPTFIFKLRGTSVPTLTTTPSSFTA